MVVLSLGVALLAGSVGGCKIEVNSRDDDASDAGDGGAPDSGRPASGGKGGSGGTSTITSGRGNTERPDAGASEGDAGSTTSQPPKADDALADLSDAELGGLCDVVSAEVSASISDEDANRLSCTLAALTLAIDPESSEIKVDPEQCEEVVTQCLEQGTGDSISEEMCEVDELKAAVEGCETTVGEYRACVRATAEQLAAAFDAFNCETLADPKVAEEALLTAGVETPEECEAVAADCPALVSGKQGGSDGCDDSCPLFHNDDMCDDGRPGSMSDLCAPGTDCSDCGAR
jgi:hypothetical protein